MRAYEITITTPDNSASLVPAADGSFARGSGPTFTSVLPNGVNDPGALNVEFDMPVYPFHTPQGRQWIRIWGVGLRMISQSANLNPTIDTTTGVFTNAYNFTMDGGMGVGPAGLAGLANPQQAGTLIAGQIYQAWGNWQGPEQTLELLVSPSFMVPQQKITFIWKRGQTLQSALTQMLAQSFPYYTPSFAISSLIETLTDQNTWARDLFVFTEQYLTPYTAAIGKQLGLTDYQGVSMSVSGKTLFVFDNTAPPRNVQINFQDLIGQPTWIGPLTANFKTVLRADISMGNLITFPRAIVPPYGITTPDAATPGAVARSRSGFQNSFVVNEVHHFGNFRQPDADSWATTFQVAVQPTQPTMG